MLAGDGAALIHRLVAEVYNRGNLAVAELIYGATFLLNGEVTSVRELQEAIACLHTAIPGFHVDTRVVEVMDGWIVTEWTVRRTVAELGTGDVPLKQSRGWSALRLFRVSQGRVVEVWANQRARTRLDELSSGAGAGALEVNGDAGE